MMLFKWFVNFEKEENWLNEMAQKGYVLRKRTFEGNYYFDICNACAIKYKIDYRVFSNDNDYREYKGIFLDSGWRLVYGNRKDGFQYFVTSCTTSDDDIFSDSFSKAARYKRMSNQCLMLALVYIPIGIALYPMGGLFYLSPLLIIIYYLALSLKAKLEYKKL